MGCSRTIQSLLLLLVTLCSSCDRECHCPEGCTHCEDCWCDCCGNRSQSTIVQIILPEGATAESFHLTIGPRNYDFCGNTKAVKLMLKPQDILVYNNDGETIIADEKSATTHTSYESADQYYQPTPFYSLSVKDTLITRQDTVRLYLSPRVKTYRIHALLKNNAGTAAVTACSDALVKGLAREINLWSGARTGIATHRLPTQMKENEVVSTLNTWGQGEAPVHIAYLFRCGNKQLKYLGDITAQIESHPEGGDIYLTIDAAHDLEEIETTETEGFHVGAEEWNDIDTTIDI